MIHVYGHSLRSLLGGVKMSFLECIETQMISEILPKSQKDLIYCCKMWF